MPVPASAVRRFPRPRRRGKCEGKSVRWFSSRITSCPSPCYPRRCCCCFSPTWRRGGAAESSASSHGLSRRAPLTARTKRWTGAHWHAEMRAVASAPPLLLLLLLILLSFAFSFYFFFLLSLPNQAKTRSSHNFPFSEHPTVSDALCSRSQ